VFSAPIHAAAPLSQSIRSDRSAIQMAALFTGTRVRAGFGIQFDARFGAVQNGFHVSALHLELR
jgi:hypothetical protein